MLINDSKQALHNWSKKNSEFLDALQYIKSKQKPLLLVHGLAGDYNPTFAKLILSSDQNMREHREKTHKFPRDGERELVDQLLGESENQ